MRDLQSQYANQLRLIAALREPRRYPHAVRSVPMIETHISWVLLAGGYAYKIKKAVDLGFLDYSTLPLRRICCEEEIRLNRRTAPDLYLDVVAIGGSAEIPQFGMQPAIEYAVRMRRFDDADLMDKLLQRGKIVPRHIDDLAAVIAAFHAAIPAAAAGSGFGTPASIRAAAMQNFTQLRVQLAEDADLDGIAALEAATEAEFAECRAIFAARAEQGRVRECHGDLHLGNIVLVEDRPVPFDCIEFNPELRWIDVMDEIAFPVMDLLHRHRDELAWRLLNAYLEGSGDYGGVSVLRFYLVYRAVVRAKVSAFRAAQCDISRHAKVSALAACRSYLALARRCLGRYCPALVVTHGLPGSGKTTFSQLALQQLGAIRIRSDVERKRLFGLGGLESSRAHAGDIYGAEATQRTYARLHELARSILLSGLPVIVDAAFLRLEEREAFRKLAQDMAVPFAIVSLHASEAVLRERVQQRRNDASEADAAVLELLRSRQQPLTQSESAYTVLFTTEETPDSDANARAWKRLDGLLAAVSR